jgi:cellobiose phosphorylase
VLQVDPCIPCAWPRYEILFRYHSARYRLSVENPRGIMRGVTRIALDDGPVSGREIPLVDDGREHRIAVELG